MARPTSLAQGRPKTVIKVITQKSGSTLWNGEGNSGFSRDILRNAIALKYKDVLSFTLMAPRT
jgi:hypothetical protein